MTQKVLFVFGASAADVERARKEWRPVREVSASEFSATVPSMPDFYERVAGLIRELNLLSHEGTRLCNGYRFRGYGLWWFFQSHLFRRIVDDLDRIEKLRSHLPEGTSPVILCRNPEWRQLGEVISPDARVVCRGDPLRKVLGGFRLLWKGVAHGWLLLWGAVSLVPYLLRQRLTKVRPRLFFTNSIGMKKSTGEDHQLEPLLERCRADPDSFPVELRRTHGFLDELRLVRRQRRPYLTPELALVAPLLGPRSLRSLWREWRTIRGAIDLFRRADMSGIRYEGLPYGNILRRHLVSIASRGFPSRVLYIMGLEWILRILRVSKVYVTDESDSGRSIAVASELCDIPSFGIQHGLVSRASVAHLCEGFPEDQPVPAVRTLCVFGERTYRFLQEHSAIYRAGRIAVVGQVRTDILFRRMRETADREARPGASGLTVLFISQPWKDLKPTLADFFMKAFGEHPDVRVLVKLHPGERDALEYLAALEKSPWKGISFPTDADLYELLLECDVMVALESTVVIEALIFEKPIVILKFPPKYDDPSGFVAQGIAVGVSRPEDLYQTIRELVTPGSPRREELLAAVRREKAQQFFAVDGKTAERVYALE